MTKDTKTINSMPFDTFDAFVSGLNFIAWNDEPTIRDEEEVATFISVQLLSEVFCVSAAYIATTVVAMREDSES